jgi:hypothetical protein
MIFSTEPEEWFAVVNMYLEGALVSHPRGRSALAGARRGRRGVSHRAIINTTSESGPFGQRPSPTATW